MLSGIPRLALAAASLHRAGSGLFRNTADLRLGGARKGAAGRTGHVSRAAVLDAGRFVTERRRGA